MQVAVIGPLAVLTDDMSPVLIPGAQERLLLAALTAGAPRPVNVALLVETLSEGNRALTSTELHEHVVRLRRCLEPFLPKNASGRYVLRRGSGYALAVAPGEIDGLRVTALATRGRARLAAGELAEATRLLSMALLLWRGDPYSDWANAR